MKRIAVILPIILFMTGLAAGCGGSGSGGNLGPILDISQVQALVVDQLSVTGGLDDEYRSQGEYTLYLRDAATGEDLACIGAAEGMGRVAGNGIYQAGLALKFREVEAEHPSSAARFKLVVVEKDGPDCPSPIGSGDDLVGESAELTSEELIGAQVSTTNGNAVVVLRQESQPALEVGQMEPSLTDGLQIDQLSFSYEADDGAASRFYLYAERMEGDTAVAQCQVEDALLEPIRFGNILYAALGFPFTCLDPTDPGFPEWMVRVGVYVQTADGPRLIGQTEARKIGDIIGEKVLFAEGEGFVSFRRVQVAP